MSVSCLVRRRLAEEFSTVSRLYAETVANLAVPDISQDDYVRLCCLAEEAQNRSMTAFVALKEHLQLHQCLQGSSAVHNIVSGRRKA